VKFERFLGIAEVRGQIAEVKAFDLCDIAEI
jgi:hypothetical protein